MMKMMTMMIAWWWKLIGRSSCFETLWMFLTGGWRKKWKRT